PGHRVLWGGETAGALLTGHLRPEVTTVYASALPKDLIIQERLTRDPDGDVEIRRRFWRRDLPSPRADVVPAPLVYADLLAVGDSRTAETAELVRGQHLV
ncbi:MAG: type IV toxin-antitoxin system AbiEi family antitoxin, partial [Micromonosporaceae bacterium]